MKKASIFIAQICMVLLALLLLIALAKNGGVLAEDHTPTVNADGLCEPETVTVTAIKAYTDDDATALAQMLYGEARGCTVLNQQQCVWCVLNRVEDERFPDSVIGVVSQPGQFYGYSAGFPVLDELKAVAVDVLERWSAEKQGIAVERELDRDMLWFTGNGVENVFRREY